MRARPSRRTIRSVNIRVEDAATTAEALAKGDKGIDGWLTLEPWPDIANDLVTDRVFETATPIASSPFVITMVKEREVVLAPACPGGVVGWKCLGDKVGQPWTTITGGVPSWGNITVGNPPLTSATGLLLFGNAVTGYFGRTDIATNDFDDAFDAWRGKMKQTFMETDPFTAFVTQLPAKFAAVGVTAAEEQTEHRREGRQGRRHQPDASGNRGRDARAGGLGRPRAEQVGRAGQRQARCSGHLKTEGWAVGSIPAETGLPDHGVLLALSGLSG